MTVLLAILYALGCVAAYWLGRQEGQAAMKAYKEGVDKGLTLSRGSSDGEKVTNQENYYQE